MKWTKGKPRQVGYYWYRDSSGSPPIVVELLQRKEDEPGHLLVISYRLEGNGVMTYIDNLHGQWSDETLKLPIGS